MFFSRYLDSNNLQNLTAGVFSTLTTLSHLYVCMTYIGVVEENIQAMNTAPFCLLHLFIVLLPVAAVSSLIRIIVHREKWFGMPVNIKEANKQAKIYVSWSLTLLIFVLSSFAMR